LRKPAAFSSAMLIAAASRFERVVCAGNVIHDFIVAAA
jgi:hypothetical protein